MAFLLILNFVFAGLLLSTTGLDLPGSKRRRDGTAMTSLLIFIFVLVGLPVYITGLDLPDYKDHPCIRPCESGQTKVCEYNFTLEVYYTMSKACYNCPFDMSDCDRPHCVTGDGSLKSVLTVNRMLPGPGIHVCEGDTVIVNVKNLMNGGEGTSIHWHGLHVPPHMDGTAMINQCPINLFSTFQYKFIASTPGTHYWHAHSGLQNGEGLFGPFVIRRPPQDDVHSDKYDVDSPEYTVIVNDWTPNTLAERFAQIYHYSSQYLFSESMLINGQGSYHKFEKGNETAYTPYSKFNVETGKRYRFRLISNALNTCPISFAIDNHNLTLIASDGSSLEPIEVGSLTIYSGERIDFILDADKPIDNYWMRVNGLNLCAFNKAVQLGVVRYDSASLEEPSGSKDWTSELPLPHFDPMNLKTQDGYYDISQLNATVEDDEALKPIPDRKIYLRLSFENFNNQRFHQDFYNFTHFPIFTQQINHITSFLPPSPVQTQYSDDPKEIMCNSETVGPECSTSHCECYHLIEIPLGEVVEIIFVDEGPSFDSNHPFHIHGNYFRVIGLDRLGSTTSVAAVKTLDEAGQLKRKLNKAPLKDSFMIHDGGYTIVRFHAKTPGFWLLHCHLQVHTEMGMMMTLQVGTLAQQPKVPKNFPKCGSWHFDGYEPEPTKTPVTYCPTDYASTLFSSYQLIFSLGLLTLILTKV